ncbi:hypothetical protein [Candidatus Magnetominusculus dajiuhuensis]|uniref:hypothetical protein n=1 Tax=Candidatus Magnetominusculus dajiuhuensis TaxID=3137712 RepID=UPI003B43D565
MITYKKLLGIVTVFSLVLALALICTASTARCDNTVDNETFSKATASGWTLSGSAKLTAASGGVDNVTGGSGWLRLTDNVTKNQAGSAVYGTAFTSVQGVQVSFTYASYGGTGADGLTFYLIDGATGASSITTGASGGALGYSSNGLTGANGVTNGYLGIGFDEGGYFSSSYVGTCSSGCPGISPNSVAIRGSGNKLMGYNFLTNAPATIATGSRSGANTVTITILDFKVTVVLNGKTVINNYDISTAIGQSSMPGTFKFGFSAGTGGSTNIHEIKNLSVTSVTADYNLALATLYSLSNYFGTPYGSFTAYTYNTSMYYVQGLTNGNFLVAWSDGSILLSSGGQWFSTGLYWKTFTDVMKASQVIGNFYTTSASFYGGLYGGLTQGLDATGVYYVQGFNNGYAIVAWPDGYVYIYAGGTAYSTLGYQSAYEGTAYVGNGYIYTFTNGLANVYSGGVLGNNGAFWK